MVKVNMKYFKPVCPKCNPKPKTNPHRQYMIWSGYEAPTRYGYICGNSKCMHSIILTEKEVADGEVEGKYFPASVLKEGRLF